VFCLTTDVYLLQRHCHRTAAVFNSPTFRQHRHRQTDRQTQGELGRQRAGSMAH